MDESEARVASEARRIGFFDGLYGRLDRSFLFMSRAYTEGYQRGREVWRRPRRKRPTRTQEQP